jgi:hypothetical protein
MDPSTRTAVVEDVLDLEGGAPVLKGTRCRDCGAVYFPRAVSCRNPACDGKAVEPVRIAGRGRLYSFTIQRYRPPPLFALEPWAHYALGLIDVEDGLRLMGIIDAPLDAIRIGMPLSLSTTTLGEAGGRLVVTHAFVPDAVGASA